MARQWGVVVAFGLMACGKSASDTSMDVAGAGASTVSGSAGTGASAGTRADATAGTAGAPTVASGAGGVASSAAGAAGAPSVAGAAGVAGASGASGASASGRPGFGADPLPAPDPVNVVATSNSYVVFSQSSDVSSTTQDQLMFLDLKASAPPVQLNAAAHRFAMSRLSRNGRFFAYQRIDPYAYNNPKAPNPPREDDLNLAGLSDSGYQLGAAVSGFAGRAALHLPLGFDSSARFSLYGNLSKPGGLDLVDTASNARYDSLTFTADYVEGGFAPKGYLFFYTPKSTAHSSVTDPSYLAKVNDGGISEPLRLPANVGYRAFSADGRRLFYSAQNSTGSAITFGYIEPPAAPLEFYTAPSSSNYFMFNVEAGAESVLTLLPDPSDATRWIPTRIFVDPAHPPEALSDPNTSASIAMSESGSLAVLSLAGTGDKSVLELVRGTEHFKVVEATGASGSFVGERLRYYVPTDKDMYWEVRSATLSGSSLVDRQVVPADHHITRPCSPSSPSSGSKYADVFDEPAPGIRFSDMALDGPTATRVINASDPTATVECPVCNLSDDACAYVEHTSASSKLFVVRFGPTGPSAPTLVYESAPIFGVLLSHVAP